MDIEEIKKLELEECSACSGSGCYCDGSCGACDGTGLEYDSNYLLTLKENLIYEQVKTIESLKCCGNCKYCDRIDLVFDIIDCSHEDVCSREVRDHSFNDLWEYEPKPIK